MTNDKKIRIFYILSALGMVIGMITVGLCLVGFNVEEYGNFSLYTTFTFQLGILSFGYQDGMLINYRKKQYGDVLPTLKRDIKFGFAFQTIILILCIIVAMVLQAINVMKGNSFAMLFYAMLSFYPMTLLGNIRNALSATGRFNIVGYVDFFIKCYLFVSSLLVVIFKLDVNFYILFDIIVKLILVVGLYIMIFKDARQEGKKEPQPLICTIKDNFNKGLWILLGSWASILVFSLDRNMLQNHIELIGIYSYAMFAISTIYQLLTPLKPVLVSQINEHMPKREVYLTALRFTSILFIVSLLYVLIGDPLALWLINTVVSVGPNILPNPQQVIQGIEASSLLITMLPLYVCINIFFNTLLIITNQKRYAFVEMTNAIISIITYVVFVLLYKDNLLLGVIYGSIANYFISFLYNSLYLSGIINTIKLLVLEAMCMSFVMISVIKGWTMLALIAFIPIILMLIYIRQQRRMLS